MSSEVAELERSGDAVPVDWRQTSLGGALAKSEGGGTPPRDVEEYWNGDIPWASVKDVVKGEGSTPEETITPAGLANSTSKVIPAGTNIFAARMGVGAVVRYPFPVAINQDLMALTPSPALDPGYLYYWLQARKEQFVAVATGTTVKGIRKDVLLSFPMALPPLDEQRRIAEVLRFVDEAIAANQSVLQQSETALSALSDELFAASLSDEGSGWPQHPLEAMLDNIIDYRGVPPPKAASGIPLLTAKNVRFGYLDFEPREFIAAKDYDSWMRRGLPSAGDIMFTTEAPLGNVAEFPDIKAALGQRTLTLVPKARVLDAKFLKWLLLSKQAQNLIWSHATGSTAKGIKQRTFRKLKFGFPALDEQVRIAQLLEDISVARDAAKRTGEGYTAMKAHLLSDLLSGRVRVPV